MVTLVGVGTAEEKPPPPLFADKLSVVVESPVSMFPKVSSSSTTTLKVVPAVVVAGGAAA